MSRREGSTRRFATFLFTDIVGSTMIAREMGDLRWQALIARHHAIVRRELKRLDGHELDTAGDGFFAIFDSPGAAIRCAVALTDAVREVGLEIRAGLHSGEVEITDGKPGGIAVNTAARVMAVAGHGEVLVSQALRDIVAGSSLRFEDHGVHTLKGIDGEWRLFLVTEVDGERVADPLDVGEAARRRMAVEPASRTRSRTPVVLAIGAVVALAVVAVLVLGGGDDGGGDAGPSLVPTGTGPAPNSIASLDVRTGDIVIDRDDVSESLSAAHDIEVAYGSVWVIRIPIVLKVDPEDGSHVPVHGVSGNLAEAIGVGFGKIWLARSVLYPVDPATGAVDHGVPYVGNGERTFLTAQDVTTSFGSVWVASNDGSVFRVDPDGAHSTRIDVGDAPERIAAGTDAMWVLDPGSGKVWRIDPKTDVVHGIGVSGGLDELAVGGGFVWVLDSALGTITQIDETTGDVRRPIPVGDDPTDVAFGLGSVWVARGGDVLEIDPATGQTTETFTVGDNPIAALAVDDASSEVWLDMASSG